MLPLLSLYQAIIAIIVAINAVADETIEASVAGGRKSMKYCTFALVSGSRMVMYDPVKKSPSIQ
jgi:hypothetical protein